MKWNDKNLLDRFKAAKADKTCWDSLLEEAYRLFCPVRNTIYKQSKGNNRTKNVFTSAGEDAFEEFANNIKAKLLPSNMNWAQMVAGGAIELEKQKGELDEDDVNEINKRLDVINRTVFQFIGQSNFDTAVHESIQDMAVSIGALLCLDNNSALNPIRFVAVPASEVIPEAGPYGDIQSVYREYKVTARDIEQQWPKRKPDAQLDDLIKNKGDKKLYCIEATIYDPQTKKYDYVVYVKEAGTKIIYEDEYDVSPWIVFRWLVSPGEVMGRGPAIKALNDMRVFNKLRSQLLRNNDMAINPPLMMNGSALSIDPANVRVRPGSKIVTKMNYSMQSEPLRYLENNSRFDVGQHMNDEYKEDLKKCFYSDVLGAVNAPVKSATEIQIRDRRSLEQLGSAVDRLESELVQKTIARVYSVLSKYDYVPKELKVDGVKISVNAVGPLSRLKNQADIEAVMNYFQDMMMIAGPQQGPMLAASAINMSELANFMTEKNDVPGKLRLTKREREAQMQQTMQAGQDMGMIPSE